MTTASKTQQVLRLCSDWKIPKSSIQILTYQEFVNVKLDDLKFSVEGIAHTNCDHFTDIGETWGYVTDRFAFTIYDGFHGGVSQFRRIGHIFLIGPDIDTAVAECHQALTAYWAISYNNMKHPDSLLH